MTVASTIARKTFAGDAVTTSFGTSPMVFFDTSDLEVRVTVDSTGVSTLLTEGTHYSVSGGGALIPAVGTVSLAGGSSPYGAVAAGSTLVVTRVVSLTQGADFVQNDSSDADVAESTIDKLTMIVQQQKDTLDRAFTLATGDVSGASTVLPTPSVSKLIGWNDTATALVNYTAASLPLTAIAAFVATLLDDASADAFVQTLVAGLTAETAPATDDVVLLGDTSEGAGNKMTLANLLKVVNSLTADSTPDKTADFLLSYDASASAVKKVLMQETAAPRSYLAGFGMTNGTDATNDIDFAAGECRDSTNAVNIRCSALTKQLDAAWAVGTAAGGRDTGAIANNTWHCYAIRKDSDGTGDFLFSLSVSAPTMPAGYTFFRRIGSIIRSGATILGFVQDGDYFRLKAIAADISAANPGTAAVSRTLTVPVGINVHVLGTTELSSTVLNVGLLLSDLSANDDAPAVASGITTLFTVAAAQATAAPFSVRSNTSAQIRSRVDQSDANTVVRIATHGWLDRRGRDA